MNRDHDALIAVAENLRNQMAMVFELRMMAVSMQRALGDVVPGFEDAYAKHYGAEKNSVNQRVADAAVARIHDLIEQLKA
jgi:hypothetical protein